jgi:hypothetical protein
MSTEIEFLIVWDHISCKWVSLKPCDHPLLKLYFLKIVSSYTTIET